MRDHYSHNLFSTAKKEKQNKPPKKNDVDSISNIVYDDSIICFEGCGPDSEYKGGLHAWLLFLKKHLIYPKNAIDMNMEGKVIVQFCIEKNGLVSNVEAIYGPDLLRASAVKVIKLSSGKWIPCMQNGRRVRSYKKQPIVFKLTH